jgi:hypothetical protein
MSTPFLAQIETFSFNFAPKGWAQCNGQLLPINQNQALFALLGTTYGGDGRVNFALPDLRSRVPIHMGSGFTLGERGGVVDVHACQMRGIGQSRRCLQHVALQRGESQWRAMGGNHGQHRRQPGSHQHHAISLHQHVHRPAGDIPVADLTAALS